MSTLLPANIRHGLCPAGAGKLSRKKTEIERKESDFESDFPKVIMRAF